MLSIIIVAMGENEELKACIASVEEHVRLPHEIILVNNSSSRLSLAGPGLACVENGHNTGFARAVNRGIEAAHGDRILLLNPDACFTSDIVSEMSSFMDAHRRAGIVAPQLVFPDGSLQNSIDIIPNLATEFINKSLLKILFPGAYPSKRTKFRRPVQVPSVIGACMMIRKEVIDAVGPLDEGYFLYLEETDFCKRVSDAGFEVWHLPHLTVVHHQGTSARIFDTRRKIEYQRSMMRFFRKHRGAFQALMLAALTLIKLIVETAGNAPLALTAKGEKRFRRSCHLLLWHLVGRPEGWGLEHGIPPYRKVRRNGYTWFLAGDADIPEEAAHPGQFMERFGDRVLNRSRTTFVKTGFLGGRRIYLKRYNFKGAKDTIKNLFRKGRAQLSFEGALMLSQCLIPTPVVVFACERRILGLLLDSYVATERVEARDLVEHIAASGYDRPLIVSLARLIRRIHEMGFVPVDLKGENILVGKTGFYLIDLDRLRRVPWPGMKTLAKNLSYLNASFSRTVPHHDREAFLEDYIKGNPRFRGMGHVFARMIKELTEKRIRERY